MSALIPLIVVPLGYYVCTGSEVAFALTMFLTMFVLVML